MKTVGMKTSRMDLPSIRLEKHRRFLASFMAASLLLTAAGCGKKKTRGKSDLYSAGHVIEETDPYFTADMKRVQIPVESGKKVESLFIRSCTFTGEVAVISYGINYEIPEDIMRIINTPGITLEEAGVDLNEYETEATAIFDAEGKMIRQLKSGGEPIYGAAMDKDGNIHVMYEYLRIPEITKDMTSEEAQKAFENSYPQPHVLVFSGSGDQIREIVLPINAEEWSDWRTSFSILDDGTYAYSTGGSVYLFDKDGNKISTIADVGREIRGSIIVSEGKEYVLSELFDQEGNRDYQIKEILDRKNAKLGPAVEAKALSSFHDITATKEGIFVSSYSAYFKYDMNTDTLSEFFSWNDTDVDRTTMRSIECTPKSEKEILAVGHKNDVVDYPYLIRLIKEEKNPHAGKKMIVLGGEGLSNYKELMSFASTYSSNPENSARVVVVDYTTARKEEEYGNIEQQIYLDTLSGSGPDILVNMFDSVAFRSGTIMEDMNQYLDGEKGIDRDDYFDNILRACESDGALYHIPVRFRLEGLTVNTDYISNREGWTYDEFFEASEKIPEDVSFLEGVLYNDLLKLMISTSISGFIDYEGKTVDFNNEEMKRILSTVKKYGVAEIPKDEGIGHIKIQISWNTVMESNTEDLTQMKFKEGLLAIRAMSLGSASEIGYQKSRCAGKPAFLGYPSTERQGMAVHPDLSMGIVASSTSKGPAWDFIRAFIEYNTPGSLFPYSTSIRKSKFESESLSAMKSINENYESFSAVPAEADILSFRTSEEDIDEFRKLVEGVTISTGGDPVIFGIICEEAAGYFAGDRTEEEVLKNVQNRASIAVKER